MAVIIPPPTKGSRMPHRYPMTDRVERRVISELFIDLSRLMRQAVAKATDNNNGVTDGVALLTLAAVIVGHADGKPLNAMKIAQYIDQPRATVIRKLDALLNSGLIVKRGHAYLLHPKRALNPTTNVRVLLKALAAAGGALSELDTKALS